MNHIGKASMQNALHLCAVCLHQWSQQIALHWSTAIHKLYLYPQGAIFMLVLYEGEQVRFLAIIIARGCHR